MTELNLSRQSKLVPVEKIIDYGIKIFGVGSIGSHVAKVLAKTGFKDIEVFDNDIVEEENLAAQAYDFKHLKMNKVDAIKDVIKESVGIDITATHGLITEETQITPEPNIIYMCFFDSFEARKMLFDKLKDFPVIFIDGRIGQYNMRHYFVDCGNPKEKEEYQKTLETKKESELQCGEKACAPINVTIAGVIVMNLIKYFKEGKYISIYVGNSFSPEHNIVVYNKEAD